MRILAKYRFTVAISLLILAVGVIFLLLSHFKFFGQDPDALLSGMLRDFGIALCSTGLISTAYELLIRTQLLDDHEKRIREVLDPDSAHLGVRHIFGSRAQRADKKFGSEELFKKATSEITLFGAAPAHLLTERRQRLIEFIKNGGTVRLLISNMTGPHLGALDDTFLPIKGTLKDEFQKVNRELKNLVDGLRPSGNQSRLIVKCHDIVPPFGMIGVDLDTAHGVLIVELNGVHISDSDRPSLVLERRKGGLYDLYLRQFDTLWGEAASYEEPLRASLISQSERGIKLGPQTNLYAYARELRRERSIERVVYFHYSGSIIQSDITELLDDGIDVELYIQCPETAADLKMDGQKDRIAGIIRFLSSRDKHSKAHLTVWQSVVPNTVRAALFGDQFIVLSWYVYSALQARDDTFALPNLEIHGHRSFGVLIESSNPAFRAAKGFLMAYKDGLAAKQLDLK